MKNNLSSRNTNNEILSELGLSSTCTEHCFDQAKATLHVPSISINVPQTAKNASRNNNTKSKQQSTMQQFNHKQSVVSTTAASVVSKGKGSVGDNNLRRRTTRQLVRSTSRDKIETSCNGSTNAQR